VIPSAAVPYSDRIAALQPFGAPKGLSDEAIRRIEELDRTRLWKPFTQMSDYAGSKPLVIAEGLGNWLRDVRGQPFLDGVSSLWVNVHGHAHPRIVKAVQDQVAQLDHSTLLGPTNVPATELAGRLVDVAPRFEGQPELARVFYSDSGSTSVEIAVKMAFQYWAQHEDPQERSRNVFISMTNAYHGDTLGSVSVGGIDLFHELYAPLLFETRRAPAPDPYHQAFGGDVEAHEAWCLDQMRELFDECAVAALVMEPLVQGAAGMLMHSPAFLRAAAALAREHGALLILDEVATGFGRTGTLFACEQAGVVPDLLCVAKGLTGGVLPLAATLATEDVYSGFLGKYEDFRTFFHGHSFTGNPPACAAALASLDVFEEDDVLGRLQPRIEQLARRLKELDGHLHVGDVRRRGFMTGIELVADPETGARYATSLQVGNRVIEWARTHGVLIRPLGSVVVLMPPLSITEAELDLLCDVVFAGIDAVTGALA
jgi:adenosylmethionine---8-amino-7-oxononanoate aminotransferase